ncbi:MAG: hypothetical protein ACRDGR_00330 [bacterium]
MLQLAKKLVDTAAIASGPSIPTHAVSIVPCSVWSPRATRTGHARRTSAEVIGPSVRRTGATAVGAAVGLP